MRTGNRGTNGADKSNISFPILECWNPLANVAIFAAEVNKQRVSCRVSLDIPQSRFSASSEEPMEAVFANRAELRAVARKLIESGSYEEDGSILLRDEDF